MTKPKEKGFTYISGKKYDGLMGRCYRPTDKAFASYGGRGIKVCSAWIKDLATFREWLLQELTTKNIGVEEFVENSGSYQLDRIDVDGHYSPDNCRIVSPQVNTRNQRRRNRVIIESAEGESIEI